MGLRTVGEFRQSLRDGRHVRFEGQRVADVTEHPVLNVGVQTAAIDYAMADDPAVRHLAVVQGPDGDLFSRYLHPPVTPEDLLLRHQLIEEGSRRARGFPPFAKEGGSDALIAMELVAHHVDAALGTQYLARVQGFRQQCQRGDQSIAVAMTDVKGDRSRRPSQQEHPDYYVRVKERRPDGIVVAGAKAHITTAPYTNEILVLPTRAMSEADRDYAVAFAVPPATPGLTMVSRLAGPGASRPEEYPVSGHFDVIEALVLFDDVFVPWERVFLCGEWSYAAVVASTFATYHRFTAASYKYPFARLMVGAGRVVARQNGLETQTHIRDKLTWLAVYAETIKTLARAAAQQWHVDKRSGFCFPDPMAGNLAKFFFAENYHQAVKTLQDIAGGLLVTMPSVREWDDPQIGARLRHYLGGAPGVAAEDRMRMLRLIRDLVVSELGGFWEVTSLHAEGSLAAEKIALAGMVPGQEYEAEALLAAGIASPARAVVAGSS